VSDFPGNSVTPLSISSYSRYCGSRGAGTLGALAVPASITWTTANIAYFLPLQLPWSYEVKRFFWGNGSAAGNMDVGIYTRGGVRLASTGAVAQTPASDIQYAAPSGGAFLLDPGEYLLGISNNGTTNRGWGSTAVSVIEARLIGIYSMITAHPLPATATLAVQANATYPLVGITRTASGF
jgi:hypothetical protein